MKRIDTVSSEGKQEIILTLESGDTVTFNLTYRPVTQRWQLDVTYGDFSVAGIGLAVHPNILRPWRAKLGFGLACTGDDHLDPVALDDFTSGRCALYLLSSAEVTQVESDIIGVSS